MKSIVVKARKELIHRYVDAPDEVSFLREWHRHELHIEMEVDVKHSDREIEFIMIKRELQYQLDFNIKLINVEKSCEMIAQEIAEIFAIKHPGRKIKVSVYEDGENGGIYYHGFK